jgi:hypothetical protein
MGEKQRDSGLSRYGRFPVSARAWYQPCPPVLYGVGLYSTPVRSWNEKTENPERMPGTGIAVCPRTPSDASADATQRNRARQQVIDIRQAIEYRNRKSMHA